MGSEAETRGGVFGLCPSRGATEGCCSTVMCFTETTLVPFAGRCPGPETAGGLLWWSRPEGPSALYPLKERWGGTRKKPRSRLVLVPLTAGVCSGLLVKALRGTPGMTAFTLRNSGTEGMCFLLPCICLELRLPCKATCGHSGQVVCLCTPRPGTQMLGDKASDPGSPGREGLGQTFLP